MRRSLAPLGALLAALAVVPSAAPTAAAEVSTDHSLRSLLDQRSAEVSTDHSLRSLLDQRTDRSLLDQRTDRSLRPETKVVVRRYGAGPVRMTEQGQSIDLRFRGHRGDRVMLTRATPGQGVLPLSAKLTGPRGRVQKSPQQWWRLRADGWQTFHFTPYARETVAVQLNKIIRVDVERDAPARTLPVRRGRIWAAGFVVPETGLLSGTVLGKGDQLLVRPDRKRTYYLQRSTMVLGDEMPVVMGSYGHPRSLKQHAGDVERVLTAGGVASAVTPQRVAGVLDGAAIPADAERAHAVEILIDGTAGQWIRASSAMVDKGAHLTVLVGPDGDLVDPTPRRDLWQLTASGPSRLLLLPDQGTESTPLQLSSLASGPALTTEGPTVTVSTDPAGRGTIMQVVPATSDEYSRKLVTSNSTLAADWHVVMLKAHVPAYDRGCNGCGEGDYVGADAAHPISSFGNGDWVYLPPGVGSGTIDLRLTRS